jgi:hypothetical protein
VPLSEELARVAEAAGRFAGPEEEVTAVIPTEPVAGVRVYLCAYGHGEPRTWLALDPEGWPIEDRTTLRDAVTIAAMCELAEEAAGGGDLEELRTRLAEVRATEAPGGIEEAEEAARELERMIEAGPRLASPAYLDSMGAATRRLERALGADVQSPLSETMKRTVWAVDELTREVEAAYKLELR